MSDSFAYRGQRIAYRSFGSGERVFVLVHGLLMNGGMYARLGPEMAAHGHRVVCIDLLGHGGSDAPADLSHYAMGAFAEQVAALLDHLEVDRAVVGGTSLGANVALEFGVAHGTRTRGLFIEMPVLDNAVVAAAAAFTPLLVASHLGAPLLDGVAAVARRIPRSHYLLDIGLDWLRRDPRSSADVLQGLLLGRTCPPKAERQRIDAPALVVGHPSDPVHPFSDSDELVADLPGGRLLDASSILEWRLSPGRLNEELAAFLAECHGAESGVATA